MRDEPENRVPEKDLQSKDFLGRGRTPPRIFAAEKEAAKEKAGF